MKMCSFAFCINSFHSIPSHPIPFCFISFHSNAIQRNRMDWLICVIFYQNFFHSFEFIGFFSLLSYWKWWLDWIIMTNLKLNNLVSFRLFSSTPKTHFCLLFFLVKKSRKWSLWSEKLLEKKTGFHCKATSECCTDWLLTIYSSLAFLCIRLLRFWFSVDNNKKTRHFLNDLKDKSHVFRV